MAKYTTIYVDLKNKKGRKVACQIVIRTGASLLVCTDPTLAKELYEADKKQGLDVAFNEKYKTYIQRFKGMSQMDIKEKIQKELEQVGGKIK